MSQNITLNKKIILSCFLASCLEIYDFVIFAFFVPLLQKNYFVFLDQETMLVVTYILFAVGFIFRPIGSLIFGYVGDVFGRQKALVLSVSLMGSCSLIMCLLPSYSIIGISACYIITIIRIIQGISVGGEFSGALVFAIEHTNKKNAGLIGGILSAGGACGVLLATLVSNTLKSSDFPEYSWRFAFLSGFGLSIVGYIIRKKLVETPVFESLKNNRNKIPLIEGLKTHKTECLATVLIAAANGTAFYFAVIFLPNYLKSIIGEEAKHLTILITALVLACAPLAGFISDKFNRGIMLIMSCLVMTLYVPVVLNIATSHTGIILITFCFLIYGVIFAVMTATINTYAVEIFPVSHRFSCSSLCYSLGMGLIGGTVPSVSTMIVKLFGTNPIYLSMYISLVCFLAAIGVFLVKNKQSKTSIVEKVLPKSNEILYKYTDIQGK